MKQACAQYDESRRYEEALQCGFDSSAAISLLGDALNKGNEIRAHLS